MRVLGERRSSRLFCKMGPAVSAFPHADFARV